MAIVYAAGTLPWATSYDTRYRRAWVRAVTYSSYKVRPADLGLADTGPFQIRVSVAELGSGVTYTSSIGHLRMIVGNLEYYDKSTGTYVKVPISQADMNIQYMAGREIVVQFLDPGWRVYCNQELIWETDDPNAVRPPEEIPDSSLRGIYGILQSTSNSGAHSELIVSDSLDDNLLGSYVADAVWTETQRGPGWVGGKAELEYYGNMTQNISCSEVGSEIAFSALPFKEVTVPATTTHLFAVSTTSTQGSINMEIRGDTTMSGAIGKYQAVPVANKAAGGTLSLMT